MWKPIETAPMDQFLLLCGPSGYTTTPMVVTTGRMCRDYHAGRWIDHANDDLIDWGFRPTHWAPLVLPGAEPSESIREMERQKPVAFQWELKAGEYTYVDKPEHASKNARIVPLYLAPGANGMPMWQPIETAPKDNKRPLWLAQFNDDGTMQSFDYNGSWERERESWEIPLVYYYWASENGDVEEPSHWAYQPEGFYTLSNANGE